MPKGLNVHPAERVDLEDFTHGMYTFPKGEIGLANAKQVLDNQSRILSGFRVEVPDQTVYPGRIVVHGGYALDPTGQRLFTEDYLTVSRTTTLDGANTTFWVEVEFIEVDADGDARAFWDPTVLQPAQPSGDPSPNGQEFGDTVATRKALDWRIVSPIRTGTSTGFERDSNPSSVKIPITKLATNASGQITGITTEKAATVILEVLGTAPGKLRVQDAQHFLVGDVVVSAGRYTTGTGDTLAAAAGVVTLTDAGYTFSTLFIGQPVTIAGATTSGHNGTFIITARPAANQIQYNNPAGGLPASETFNGTWTIGLEETKTIATTDVAAGTITLTGNIKSYHFAGGIVRGTGSSAPNFLQQSKVNRYGRIFAPDADCRDRMFQGDEIHGLALSQGLDSADDKSDLNLRTLKDHVDYLSAQLEEMRWGWYNPYEGGDSRLRTPPGMATALPTQPRYFHRAGGIMGARTAAVTVGDGVSSWGDFIGQTQVILQRAHDSLPASGGRIFLKRGIYALNANFNWTNAGNVTLEGEEGSVIALSGGNIHIVTAGSVSLKNLAIVGSVTNVGILVDTANPADFEMNNVLMQDAAFNLNADLPVTASFRRVRFLGASPAMAAIPLFSITGGPGSIGTISGTFTECDFTHITMWSAASSLIDCATATPTAAMYQANFVDCSFNSGGANFESISLGATSSIVHFDRCIFFGWLTLCHVRATSGSNNIKLTNCIGLDNFAALFMGTGITYLEVSGYSNGYSTGWPAVDLLNCSNVKIRNCNVVTHSATSVTNCAFRIICNTGGAIFRDFLISGNTIKGNTYGNPSIPVTGSGKSTGIIFDQQGSTEIDQIRIVDNAFDVNELGVYFANSGPAATYRDIVIANNNFTDSGSTAAKIQKVGILFGSVSTRDNVTVDNNVFSNMNPFSTALIGAGITRAGVWVSGVNNSNFKISNNEIKNIGDGTNPLPDSCGIYILGGFNFAIKGNQIAVVSGLAAFGIRISNNLEQSLITDNTINAIITQAGGTPGTVQGSCFGISAESINGSTISNNSISTISNSTTGNEAGAIGSMGSSSAYWSNCTIVDNTFLPNAAPNYPSFFAFNGLFLIRSSISNNTCNGDAYMFIDIVGRAGGAVGSLTISGNSAVGMLQSSVRIDLTASASKLWININGNTLYNATGTVSAYFAFMQGLTVNNNHITSNVAASNIVCVSCISTIIHGNYLFCLDGVSIRNIDMSNVGNVRYSIGDNICDRTGGIAGVSILTVGSGNNIVPAGNNGQGMITDNMMRVAPAYNAGDIVSNSTTTFP